MRAVLILFTFFIDACLPFGKVFAFGDRKMERIRLDFVSVGSFLATGNDKGFVKTHAENTLYRLIGISGNEFRRYLCRQGRESSRPARNGPETRCPQPRSRRQSLLMDHQSDGITSRKSIEKRQKTKKSYKNLEVWDFFCIFASC